MRGYSGKSRLKTPEEIAFMREAGKIVWGAHQVAAEMLAVGVSTQEIDAEIEAYILSQGGVPLFKGVPGDVPFPAASCLSVNEAVVHGIPNERALCEGDILSIDIGVRFRGWCGDAAVTRPVGAISEEKRRLLEVTEGALGLAIREMATARRWSEVAREISRYVSRAGFSLAEGLAGHGIGREMWEALHAPNASSRNYERFDDFELEPGIVIAVEPMVNVGTGRVTTLRDHWTIVTADGKPSAHFEHTLAITSQGVIALTASPEDTGWGLAARAPSV